MENSKCSHPDCELEVYENHDKCVLHCQKDSDYKHKDWSLYKAFNKAFIKEIFIQLKEASNDDNEITFDNIVFPQGKFQDSFFYNKAIKKLKAIHFNYCEFNIGYLELDNTQCFFQDCRFHTSWTLPNCTILENEDNVIYQMCTFYGNISNYTPKDNRQLAMYQASQFDYTCRFKKDLKFNNVKFKKPLFYSAQNNFLKDKNLISRLVFDNCTFEQPFKLNNYKIDYFTCKDTVFKNKSKFEFKNNEIENFEIKNTNFKALVDCYDTEFKSFFIEKSIFEKFTGFEKCKFGENNKKENNEAKFEYATFLDFINFRDAVFYNGLDLRNANLKEYPNFLGVKIEPNLIHKKTDKETFRIIKYSFDKVGNTIEANKFFAYEMDKERENTLLKNNLNKKVILTLNYWISNFGQSWLRPLGLILLVAIFHTLFINAIDKGTFNFIYPSNPIYDFLKGVVDFSNDLAKNILPFKKTLIKGKEFISLVFLIIYSTLLYNFIVAVKRISKR